MQIASSGCTKVDRYHTEVPRGAVERTRTMIRIVDGNGCSERIDVRLYRQTSPAETGLQAVFHHRKGAVRDMTNVSAAYHQPYRHLTRCEDVACAPQKQTDLDVICFRSVCRRVSSRFNLGFNCRSWLVSPMRDPIPCNVLSFHLRSMGESFPCSSECCTVLDHSPQSSRHSLLRRSTVLNEAVQLLFLVHAERGAVV